jgi:hypothetical protein
VSDKYKFHIHYPQSYFEKERPDTSQKYDTENEAHEALMEAMKFLTERYGGEWTRDNSDKVRRGAVVYRHDGGIMLASIYVND